MARPNRWTASLVLVLALALLVWLAPAASAQHRVLRAIDTSLDQCANRTGGTTAPINDCTGSAWTSGNVNRNSSLYREGDFVPMRSVVKDLVAGRTYTYRIGYDAVESGLHAFDYLGTFDASAFAGQQIVPCTGVSGTGPPHACGTAPSTIAVPIDTATTFPTGRGQKPGDFSMWGATLSSAAYVNPAPIGVDTPGKVQREVDVTFTAHGDTVVLAWGAHLASTVDWGAGRTFLSAGSGSSFHMRLVHIQPEGEQPVSTGNKEISLSASVLAPVPTPFTTQVIPSSVTVGQQVVDTASLGASGTAPVTGEVSFFVCGPASSPPDCTHNGTEVLPQVAVLRASRVGVSPGGTASIAFTPTEPGHYCFRAEFTPSDTALYSPAAHTNLTTECFVATLPPARLTVTKLCVPTTNAGLFNLLVDGTPFGGAAGTDVPCGGSAGPFDTTAGTHQVSETAGTGTNLGNYVQPPGFGADCAPAGLVTAALGESATCTITNVRLGEPTGFLQVTKVCEPADDDGQFGIHVDESQVANLSCGRTTAAIELATGSHTVREDGVPPTSLADYTTVISGACDAATGAVTVVANQTAHCTFTNTRIPPTTTLEVRKVCVPADDDGHFKLLIQQADGQPVKRNVVACGGTTGAVTVQPGSYRVRERGANGTDLSHYNRFIGRDCQSDGTITLVAGDEAVCTIVNVRRKTPAAELTVTKICVPADDGGRFNLTVDGQTAQNVACGGSFGPTAVPPGQHQVSESAGTGTNLGDYTTTIGGACAADGTVTLAAGQLATCTITNVRAPEQTGTLEIQKQCNPAGTKAHFQLEFDGEVFRGIACGESTGPVTIGAGDHQIGEVALPGQTGRFETTIGGGCSASGSVTVSAGQHVTCVITNTLVTTEPPLKPPPACYKLSVAPRTVAVGRLVLVVARVHLGRRPIPGVRVYAVAPGLSSVRTTGRGGRALFLVRFQRRGLLHVSIRRPFACPKPPPKKVGIVGAATPPVTG
jgi:hypothetical protein